MNHDERDFCELSQPHEKNVLKSSLNDSHWSSLNHDISIPQLIKNWNEIEKKNFYPISLFEAEAQERKEGLFMMQKWLS